jgi:hypothetical protein
MRRHGRPVAVATDLARTSAWSKPRWPRRSTVVGTQVTKSGVSVMSAAMALPMAVTGVRAFAYLMEHTMRPPGPV